jgi:hypothetical protein
VKRLLKVDPNHIKAEHFKRENDQRLANLVGRVPSGDALEPHRPGQDQQAGGGHRRAGRQARL